MTEGTVSETATPLELLLLPVLASAYGTALRLTRNAADAEDLVQEAAFQACRGFKTFVPGSNFRAWFFRILTNCFYSRHRKQRREGVPVELDDSPELFLYSQTAAAGLHAETPDPAGWLLDQLDGEAVGRAIESMPEDYRMVATLYFMQDCSYQEIAEILQIPVGTVRSRLHRSRRMLQKALWTIAEARGLVAGMRSRQEESRHD